MNYSRQRLTRMLQGTNARTLPMQMNSVRALATYKESMNAQDLLDLYVGNTHYRQVNKALRAPDINTAKRQVWDEKGLMNYNPVYPPIDELLKSYPRPIAYAIDAAALSQTNPSIPTYAFESHPLFENNLDLLNQDSKTLGKQILDYHQIEPKRKEYDLTEHQKAEDYFQQVLSSAPHIEDTLNNRPSHIYRQQNNESLNLTNKQSLEFEKYIAKVKDTGDKYMDFDTENALADYINANRKLSELNIYDYKSGDFLPEPTYDFISGLINNETLTPISRGLHFKNETDYNNFINQHQVGSVVEYPAFTSTTTLPNIQDAFASERRGEIPVFQDIYPSLNNNQYNAFDVNNPAEGERLYPPGQRFKVVSSKAHQADGAWDMDEITGSPIYKEPPIGRQMTLQETDELTPVEQRTRNILSKMKSLVDKFNQ